MSTEWTTVGKTRTESANRFAGLGSSAGAYQPRSQKMTVSDPAYEARQARRREAEEEMLRNEAERKRMQEVLAAAKKIEADSMNYDSETFYPSLGSTAKPINAPAGAWGKKLDLQAPVTPTAKPRVEEEMDDAPYVYEDYTDEFVSVALRRDECMMFRPLLPPTMYRDTSEDDMYETEEINMNYESDHDEMMYSDDEGEETEDEFNENTIADRRRGDHGMW